MLFAGENSLTGIPIKQGMDDFDLDDISDQRLTEMFSLAGCQDCGACARACPSARHGGIDPHELVQGMLGGGSEENVWDCLLCYICDDVCPADIGIALLITHLRYRSALEGDAPGRFKRGAASFLKEGRGFPKGPRTARSREDLGLPEMGNGDRAMRELGKIVSRTRFSHE